MKIKINSAKLSIFTFFNALVLGFFNITSAEVVITPTPPAIIQNPLGANDLAGFFTLLLDTIFPIASMLCVFLMIYAGFMMVMAGGNEEKLSKAKTAFLWTMIGVGILLGAKVLSAVICGTVNQLVTSQMTCVTP